MPVLCRQIIYLNAKSDIFMKLARRSGILLHPTSLPGPYGSGDFGTEAFYFVDWLSSARQSLWQMLPLGDIGMGNSPYMSPSAFAGNVLLISLDTLQEAGWLEKDELSPDVAFESGRVNFPAVMAFRLSRLRKACDRFFSRANSETRLAFNRFCQKAQHWLDSYAQFRTLSDIYGTVWQQWPEPLARRHPEAIEAMVLRHPNDIRFWKFCQWCFDEQWSTLRAYAHSKGIDVIGDVPIFVSLNSADVWAHPQLFDLDSSGYPRAVAGVPPDRFSDNGQHWGNPLYNWETHKASDYAWWTARMKQMTAWYDYVRLDHFRGFQAYWAIPADSTSPSEGHWLPGPGNALFDALTNSFGPLRFIAEDLGIITPEVIELRERYALPGMRILQFAFDHNPANPYLPHHYTRDTVVYTGTHDNDTIRGWWYTLPERDRDYARRYMSVSGEWISWDLIRTAWASVAAFALTPYQDILGLDTSSRMNRPGEKTGSWEWRFTWEQVASWYSTYLAEMTEIYGRT